MSENESVTLRLGNFDRHGTTRAPYDGHWIEVEHGIPGETVRATVTGGKRVRGHIVEVIEAAPDRVQPPCPYFRDWACGGCQWQHISYEGQVERKRQSVEAAMRARGHALSITAVHTLDDPWRYRSTAGVSLGRSAGFRRQASLAIVPLRDCPISDPLIGRLTAELNDGIEAGRIPNYRGRVRIDVRVASDVDRLQAFVRPSEDVMSLDMEGIAPLVHELVAMTHIAAVSVSQPDGMINTVKGDLFAPTLVAGRQVWLAAASFFQTNLLLLPRLISRIREEAEPLTRKRVADIYGGVGVFGLFLAEGSRQVIVIESDPIAVDAGRLTAEHWGVSNVEFITGTAEEALFRAEAADVVIVDPPRSGLAPAVVRSLAISRPPLLLYVSCLPQSLARDLGPLLEAGYRVEHLELFDFYPQTYHTETLAVLRLPDRSLPA